MNSRLILFCNEPAFKLSNSPVKFAIPTTGSLVFERGTRSLDTIAAAGSFLRHPNFDGAVGDFGAKCALFESVNSEKIATLFESVQNAEAWRNVTWLPFPLAIKALTDGTCRRYLQLAVQYISAGGVAEDLIASETGEELISQMKEALAQSKQD